MISAKALVPSGTPDQMSGGDPPAPSHENSRAIAAPSANAGLLIVSAPLSAARAGAANGIIARSK